MNSKEQIKVIIQKTGKKYTQSSINNKIFLSSFRYDEVKAIVEMLGYKIKIEKD